MVESAFMLPIYCSQSKLSVILQECSARFNFEGITERKTTGRH